jgi:uncharacterized protein YdhG (YjbR/CyaY superfamily)
MRSIIMATRAAAPQSIDEYIAAFPHDVRKILQKIRLTVRQAAPQAEEKISYRIPHYVLNGELVYFAAFRNHIGLYPPAKGDKKFKQEIAPYAGEKGNLKFPLDQPIPYPLIREFVKFRVKENLAGAKARKK